MYKIKQSDGVLLEKLKFKKYDGGYSKKVVGKNYDFLDIKFEDLIVNTVKFDSFKNEFIYTPATKEDIADAVIYEIVRRIKNE